MGVSRHPSFVRVPQLDISSLYRKRRPAALVLSLLLPLPAFAVDEQAQTATPATEIAAGETQTDSSPPNKEADKGTRLAPVVVKTRNRLELQQDVPVPVSVVSGRELERDSALNISDFARRTTNVQAAELNSRRSSVSIRGVGKNVNGEEFEAPVGVIIDNVFQPYVGSSWTNFSDIENIEVARGPQGTLLGKNTTLGVLNISTQKPSFTPAYSLDTLYGSRDSGRILGSATGGIIDGLLAYRGSFFVDTGDGSIKSIAQNQSTWYDRNRVGGRLQFLLTPSEDLNARFIFSRSHARENVNMLPIVADPATFLDGTARPISATSRYARSWFGGGYTLLLKKFTVDANYVTPSIDEQNTASVEVNWNLGNVLLTSISAYNDNLFIPDNDFDWTKWDIRRGGGARTDQQSLSEELRLSSSIGESFDYQVGAYVLRNRYHNEVHTYFGRDAGAFFASDAQYSTLNANVAGRELLGRSLDNVGTIQFTDPLVKSYAVFGQADWRVTDKATLTLGLRETWEGKSNTWRFVLQDPGADLDAAAAELGASAEQLAAARAIRGGPGGTGAGQVGALSKFDDELRDADDDSRATSALFSPSYKLNEQVLLYASAARGVKSGAVSWNLRDGTPNITKPEKTIDYELGLKSTLLDRRLLVNLNLYQTNIRDFQTNQVVFDPLNNVDFRTIIGNANKVELSGVELDSVFALSRSLTLRLGGAYNIAEYEDYKDAPCQGDASATPALICDLSGKRLPGAPKFSAVIGAEYRAPVAGRALLHASVNDAYTSRQNVALNQSELGWQSARHLADVNVGVSTLNEKYDLSVLVKNLGDEIYSVDTNSFTPTSGVLERWGDRRLVALSFRAKF